MNGDVILNLGCCTDLRKDVVNIDIVRPKLVPEDVTFIQEDAFELPSHANESVDVILANFILEHVHIDQIGYALYKWNRVLKSSGILCVKVPDFEKIVGDFKNCVGKMRETEHFMDFKKMNYHLLNPGEDAHKSLWTEEFARIIFPTEGFEITNVTHEGFRDWYLRIDAKKTIGS